ncbi:MAG TPA: hydroxyethylthiazole kinase, partial [Afifellaceae bacterium]|nr:hydroxyethylthiazole kinase [Afifellaceae bacterium]
SVRQAEPRVHCLTNGVAQAFTANVLLAVGAVPSMTSDPAEVGAFVSGADGLLVNLGILDEAMRRAIGEAISAVEASDLPWVLDPVFADRSPGRAAFARELLARRPTALRLNRLEAEALGTAALSAAESAGTVVALTGRTDRVSLAGRTAMVEAGHPLMGRVTAIGCALGGVVAACLVVARRTGVPPFEAVHGAVLGFGLAGAAAGRLARGPGSFVPAFLDALHAMEPVLGARRDKEAA